MDFEEIELLAAKGSPLPENPNLETLSCYTCLQSLYREYHAKAIDIPTARRKKQEIKRAYLEACQQHARQTAAWAQQQDFIHSGGKYVCQIKNAVKARADPLAVASLCLQLYGALTGDSLSADTLIRQLKQIDDNTGGVLIETDKT